MHQNQNNVEQLKSESDTYNTLLIIHKNKVININYFWINIVIKADKCYSQYLKDKEISQKQFNCRQRQ